MAIEFGPSILSTGGAPLTQLACSPTGTSAAVLGLDNAVRLIDLAANQVRRTVHGLLQAARVTADRRLGCVVVHGGGAGGRLQWWAPQQDKQVRSLEVAPRNVSGSTEVRRR